MDNDLRPGSSPVAGYTLIERLGKGGFGEVWKATGPGGIPVALKFVAIDQGVGQVELRALEVIKHIRHPHLLSMSGSWQIDGMLIIAMELGDRTLMDRFREAVGQGFPGIPAPEIFEHFLDASKALDFLNEPRHPTGDKGPQGIQHRDIKPQNLLLVGGSVKVADFGLARMLEHSTTGHTGSMTPSYAPPEFFEQKTSSQSDQYSLAVTYCQLRGGRLPFEGHPAAVIAGHLHREPDLSMLPEAERPAVARALSKAPRDRWPSCRTFVNAVIEAGDTRLAPPTQVPPVTEVHVPPTRLAKTWEAADSRFDLAPGPAKGAVAGKPRKLLIPMIAATVVVALLILFASNRSISVVPNASPDREQARQAPEIPTNLEKLPEPKAKPEVSTKPPAVDPVVAFRPLFNGQDKSGWRTIPGKGGDWFVDNGVLVGRNGPGYLFTDRDDFEDFHLRVEARINAPGNSGVFFRAEYGLHGSFSTPNGYEAQIAPESATFDGKFRTGSLMGLAPVEARLIAPDRWFVMEVIVEGDHLRVMVDGKDASNVTDTNRRYSKGAIALQVNDSATRVEFRKLEVRDLRGSASSTKPRSPTASSPPVTVAPARLGMPTAPSPAKPLNPALAPISKGMALLAKATYDDAITAFGEAIQLDPKSAVAYAGRGLARGFLLPPGVPSTGRRRVGAQDDVDTAYRLDPRLAMGRAARGLLLSIGRSPEYGKALDECDEAVLVDPKLALAQAVRAHVYLRRGEQESRNEDLRSAEKIASEAIRLDSRLVVAYQVRGNARRLMERYEDALDDFKMAGRINPEDPMHLVFEGAALKALGRNDMAIGRLGRAIQMNPNLLPAYRQRAELFEEKGEKEKAEADRKEMARLRPRLSD